MRELFGKTDQGFDVDLFTLTNKNGLEARIASVGGSVVSLKVPDRQGRLEDILLGHEGCATYLGNPRYMGCLVGRYANRIGQARFTLNGRTYPLAEQRPQPPAWRPGRLQPRGLGLPGAADPGGAVPRALPLQPGRG